MPSSKHESKPQLGSPRRIVLAENLSKRRIAETHIGVRKPGSVGKVEKLRAHFQYPLLRELEVLEQGCIQIMNAVAAQVSVITGSVARRLVARVGERAHVEEASGAVHDNRESSICSGDFR